MEDNKNNNHKGFKVFVLLLLVGVIFFISKDNQTKFTEAYRSLTIKDKTLEQIKSIQLNPDIDKVGLLEKNIGLWSGEKLSIVDINNELIIEKQFNFDTPDIVFSENSSYIMDKSTGDIYIINNKGETLERVVLDKEISNLLVDEYYSIVHTKSYEEENLVILNNNGVFLRLHIIEDMDILTYHVDEKGEKYSISNLRVKDDLISQVLTYSINGELINTNEIQNEIVIFTKFVNDDLIILSDKCLYYIKDDKVYWKKSLSHIKDIIQDNEEMYILYGDSLEIINLEGRTTGKLSFTEDLRRMKYYKKSILLWGDYDLIGIEEDKEIFKYRHDEAIKDIIINKNYLGIVDNNSLNLFKINNR